MMIPTWTDPIPYLTMAQMIEVDRAMIEDYGIELIQMMENAGRNLAHLARARFLDGDPQEKQVVVLAGTGGNGGGALVCARHLHNYGAEVTICVTKPDERFTPIPARQLEILQRLQIPIWVATHAASMPTPDLIIDGVIGYSLQGVPRGAAAQLIKWANAQTAPILALDAPSGVDTSSGHIFPPTIKASATMTLALPKEGLRAPGVAAYVGELYLANISVPPQLYASPKLDLHVGNLFAQSDILRIPSE